jgi:predicted PurR-regulated permease PerM
VSLLIGGSLLGVVGALLAVPTAAILQVIVADVLSDDDAPSEK